MATEGWTYCSGDGRLHSSPAEARSCGFSSTHKSFDQYPPQPRLRRPNRPKAAACIGPSTQSPLNRDAHVGPQASLTQTTAAKALHERRPPEDASTQTPSTPTSPADHTPGGSTPLPATRTAPSRIEHRDDTLVEAPPSSPLPGYPTPTSQKPRQRIDANIFDDSQGQTQESPLRKPRIDRIQARIDDARRSLELDTVPDTPIVGSPVRQSIEVDPTAGDERTAFAAGRSFRRGGVRDRSLSVSPSPSLIEDLIGAPEQRSPDPRGRTLSRSQTPPSSASRARERTPDRSSSQTPGPRADSITSPGQASPILPALDEELISANDTIVRLHTRIQVERAACARHLRQLADVQMQLQVEREQCDGTQAELQIVRGRPNALATQGRMRTWRRRLNARDAFIFLVLALGIAFAWSSVESML